MSSEHQLVHAIERLTRPFQVATAQPVAPQRADQQPGQRITVVTHPPLLLQLRDAVYSGTGAHAAGNATGAERIPLDPGALSIHTNIARIVGVWYAKAELPQVGYSLPAQLEEWGRSFAAAHAAGDVTEESFTRRIARLQEWASEIEALFDPPKVVPLDAACPVCSCSWATNRDGDRVHALVVEYWLSGELVRRTAARCRNAECETEWHGIAGVQQLMELVLAQEAAQQTWEDDATVLRLVGTDVPELAGTGPIGVLA